MINYLQFPGGFPGGQPGGFPGGTPGGQQGGAPTTPPPQYTPPKPAITPFAVDPGAIRHCLFRYTYVWPQRGTPYWFYPTFVGGNSVAGFRWNGFFWMFFGIDLRSIESFTCI